MTLYGDDTDYFLPVECKHCEAIEVYWSQDRQGHWRLYDEATDELHVCQDAVDQDFEDLT